MWMEVGVPGNRPPGWLSQGRYAFKAYRQAPITWVCRGLCSPDPYWRQYARSRWGYLPADLTASNGGRTTLWFDAQALGEVNQLRGLIPALRERFPDWRVVISTEDPSAYQAAQELGVDGVFDNPWDLTGAARRTLARLRPDALIVVEHPKNPVRLREARRQGIRTLLISAFFTPGWERMPFMQRPLGLDIFRSIDRIAAKSASDQDGMVACGADPDRIDLVGDLKFDLREIRSRAARAEAVREAAGVPAGRPLLVAGSCHLNEIPWIVSGWKSAQARGSRFQLVLVPRWIESAEQIAETLRGLGVQPFLRSQPPAGSLPETGVLIVDRYGEQVAWYALSEAVFLGGSALPAHAEWRGLCHSPVEALSFGKPVFIGPNRSVRGNLCDDLIQIWPALDVPDSEALARGLQAWREAPQRAEAVRDRIRVLVEREGGVTERYLDWLDRQIVPIKAGNRS
ncbi:MAG: hypothetical protein COV76_04230 [Candidatus Omnitrophica bacterium CG11_big_fil_rev_8_21_14_0_20_64_10]|nr:MAG: hypothetical protein COV76_04230 [Candidatus Omnitrophica bacterium CG11_big_fil_rev_8_21_14_0_20_64_10]